MRAALTALLAFALYYHAAGYADDYYANVGGHQVHRLVMADHRSAVRCHDGAATSKSHHRGACPRAGRIALLP